MIPSGRNSNAGRSSNSSPQNNSVRKLPGGLTDYRQKSNPSSTDNSATFEYTPNDFPDVAKISNADEYVSNQLAQMGIKDSAPEIISLLRYSPMYSTEAAYQQTKNGNFDFFLFQNQFDLMIKEMINQKIRDNDQIKEQIYETYKDTLSQFFEDKDLIENYYISVLKTFSYFYLSEKLTSNLKINLNSTAQNINSRSGNTNSQSSSGGGSGYSPVVAADVLDTAGIASSGYYTGSTADNIKQICREMEFNFPYDKLSDFLKENSLSSLTNEEFESNFLYRKCIRFVYDSFFGVPNPEFDESVDGFYVSENEPSFKSKPILTDNINDTAREIILASRGYTDLTTKIKKMNVLRSLSGNLQIGNLDTFKKLLDFGKLSIGDGKIDSIKSGGKKLSDSANLLTEGGTNIQVFNTILKNSEPNNVVLSGIKPDLMTGREYFSRDILNNMLGNQNDTFDLQVFLKNQIDDLTVLKNSLFDDGIFKSYSDKSFNYLIRKVSKSIYDTFKFVDLNTENAGITNSGKKILQGLYSILFLAGNFEISIFVAEEGVNYPKVDNHEYIIGDLYAKISFDSDEETIETSSGGTILFNLSKQANSRFDKRIFLSSELKGFINNAGFGSLFSYSLLKPVDDIFKLEDNHNYTRLRISQSSFDTNRFTFKDFSNGLFLMLKNLIGDFSQDILNFTSVEFVLTTSIKIIRVIFKNSLLNLGYETGSGDDVLVAINENYLDALFCIRDIIEIDADQKSSFFKRQDLRSQDKIAGKRRSSLTSNPARARALDLYRRTTYPLVGSYNIISSLISYYQKINNSLGQTSDKFKKLNEALYLEESYGLENIGGPSIEKLTLLNTSYKKIFTPTTSFNTNSSYFPYLNTRISNDLICINEFHKSNSKNELNDLGRVVAIGIPDGLINRLRYASGRDERYTIIELSLLRVNHKTDTSKCNFTSVSKYLFNTCLHVDAINPNIDLRSAVEKSGPLEYEKILNIDDREEFEKYDMSTKDLLSFSFGNYTDNGFNLIKTTDFDEAVNINKEKYIIQNIEDQDGNIEYNFNRNMSDRIIKNHVANYCLKKSFESFAGLNINENLFSFFGSQSSGDGITYRSQDIVDLFGNQNISPDLLDYISRTTMTSPILNPSLFSLSALGISKFERVFFVKLPDKKYDEYSFDSIIPYMRLL